MTATLHRHNQGRVSWDLDTSPDDWRDRATCLGMDPELFSHYRTSAAAGYTRSELLAIAVCNRPCPVRAECFDDAHAATNPPTEGVVRAGLLWPLRYNPGMANASTHQGPPPTPRLAVRTCAGCGLRLPDGMHSRRLFCTETCRRGTYRQRKREGTTDA